MFKKLFTLLFALLWCTVLMAQVNTQVNEVDPNGETNTNAVDTPGDILYTWDQLSQSPRQLDSMNQTLKTQFCQNQQVSNRQCRM